VIAGVFTSNNKGQEEDAFKILSEKLKSSEVAKTCTFYFTLSHRIAEIGFLERENASILNATL